MDDDRIYQDDRVSLIREYNRSLKKALACIGHQKYEIARECFDEAVNCGLKAIKDDNQFYIKELYTTYHKYYAAFKKIKYEDGARWSLLEIVACLKRMQISKEKKTRILVDTIQKYESSGGNREDIKQKWQAPIQSD